jgi:outer membrane protein insertion porin family
MFAKQTIASASLVVVVIGVSVLARAEPEPPARVAGEARPDEPQPSPPPKRGATGVLQVGAGYNTDDKFVVRASVAQRNLFGTGMLLSLDALISARREMFRLRFVDPHVLDTNYTLGAETYFDRRVLPGFARRAVGGAVTLSRQLGDHVKAFTTYRVEDVTLDDNTVPYARTTSPDGPLMPAWHGGVIASLRTGVMYSTLDSQLMPLRGSTAGIAFESADRWLGSSLELARLDAWASTNVPLGPFTLHVGGAAHAVGSPGGVPMTERLYLDGTRDIRGYAPGGIMPNGGAYELLGRASLEMPIIRSVGISIEGFGDVGGIWDELGVGQLGRSFGFGLIWRSPLGPLRFDYAFPLVGPPRFVFGAGAFL